MKPFPGSPPVPRIERDPSRDLAGALHEVSNALTVVLGWLERAREQQQPTEALEQAHAHAVLGHSIARRAVGAPVESEREGRSALDILRGAVRGVSPIAARDGVRVTLDPQQASVELAYPAFLQQVLLNLLLNAISFSPEGGAVSLSCHAGAGRFAIRVQDEGPGVAPEKQEQLFEPGQSMRPGGAGLGLAHAHTLAESRGGELRLLKSARGACFEIDWPLASGGSLGEASERLESPAASPSGVSPRATATEAPAGSGRSTSSVLTPPSRCAEGGSAAGRVTSATSRPRVRLDGLRVIVLEDDDAVSSLLEFSLRARGAELTVMETRQQLVGFIERHGVADVALVDLSPLGGETTALLARLRKQLPSLAIFVISGCVHVHDLGVPVQGWIRKPFDMPEVVEAIASTRRGPSRSAGGV